MSVASVDSDGEFERDKEGSRDSEAPVEVSVGERDAVGVPELVDVG